MKKSICVFLVFVLTFLSLIGCSDQVKNSDPLKNTGHPVSPEDITKYNDLLTDDTTPVDLNGETVYYWTVGGSKLHIFNNCQSIAQSDPTEVKSGTIETAYYSEKTEPCSFCLKKAGIEADRFPVFVPNGTSTEILPTGTVKPAVDVDETTILYWTHSGSKLHIFLTCQSLSRADLENIQSGTVVEAYYFEKISPCAFCLKKAGLEESDFPIFVPDKTDATTPTDSETSVPRVEVDESTVLYWTKSGTKLHIFSTCQSLSKADPNNISRGTIVDAYYKGKTLPCSFCLKNAGLEESDFPLFVPDETDISNETTTAPSDTEKPKFIFNGDTVFYWTKSGTKLHFYVDCGALSGSTAINCGNLRDAYLAEKTKPCSFCLKRGNLEESEFPVYIP